MFIPLKMVFIGIDPYPHVCKCVCENWRCCLLDTPLFVKTGALFDRFRQLEPDPKLFPLINKHGNGKLSIFKMIYLFNMLMFPYQLKLNPGKNNNL